MMELSDISEFYELLSFKKNSNLRPCNAKIEYTMDQMIEIQKCMKDPIYFICNYVKVIHPDRGIVLMELYEYQKRMIDTYHNNKRVIFLTARQQGKTSVSAAYFIWYILFNDNKSVAILANKQATADEIMDRIRLAYENLPKWMQQGIKSWNKRTIELENGSKCFGAATSKTGTRGKTVNLLYCVAGNTLISVRNKKTGEIKKVEIGEFAKSINDTDAKLDTQSILTTNEWEVLTPTGWKDFDGVVITHRKSTIKIDGMECTGNHKIKINGRFVEASSLPHEAIENVSDVYDLINVADGNEYFTNDYVSHNCDEFAFVENNQAEDFFTAVYPTITAGKESKVFMTSTPNGFNHFFKFWNEAEKGINGFTPLRVHWYETPGRDITWYNTQKAVLGELKAAQELDADFLGSSLQLLSSSAMSALSYSTPIRIFNDKYQGLKIYKNTEPDKQYVMTVDVSRGRHLDASTFLIIDVSTQPYTIVASYSNNEVAPLMYAAILHTMAKQYNDAYILVEINDIGGQVAESLYYDFEYGNMFWSKSGETLGKKGADSYPGIRTTKKTKRIGCANLKDMVEKQNFLINDFQLIQELSTYVQSTSGSYEADTGFHDDMVMCGVLFAWLASQVWFKDLTDQDMRQSMYANQLATIEEELTPFGFISNAVNDNHDNSGDINSMEAIELLL